MKLFRLMMMMGEKGVYSVGTFRLHKDQSSKTRQAIPGAFFTFLEKALFEHFAASIYFPSAIFFPLILSLMAEDQTRLQLCLAPNFPPEIISQEVFYHFGGSEPELLVVEVAGTVTSGCRGMRVKLRLSARRAAAAGASARTRQYS